MVIHCKKKKKGSGFVCLAICGGKERRYHSSSRKIVKVVGEQLWRASWKSYQELSLSLFLLLNVLKCVGSKVWPGHL